MGRYIRSIDRPTHVSLHWPSAPLYAGTKLLPFLSRLDSRRPTSIMSGSFHPNFLQPQESHDLVGAHLDDDVADQVVDANLQNPRSEGLDKTEESEPEEEVTTARKRSRTSKSEHVKHRRTRTGCYTCRNRRVKVVIPYHRRLSFTD